MSTPMMMTNCPSEETLAAFIDGRLDPESRRRVVEHMSSCADCYSVISAAWDSQAADPALVPAATVVRGRFGARAVWAPAAAALAAAAMVTFVFLYTPLHDRLFPPKTGIEALVAATRGSKYRTIEGRLNGGFDYHPLKKPKRGPPPDEASEWRLKAAAGQIQMSEDRPSAQSLHLVGVSHLLAGDTEKAVDYLQRALYLETGTRDLPSAIRRSTNPTLLNDFAASLLARFSHNDNPIEIFRAGEAANRAWQLMQTSEIAWNRALCFEMLALPEDAKAAWKEYLSMDPTSEWSIEAREHLLKLDTPPDSTLWYDERQKLRRTLPADERALAAVVGRFPQQMRAWSEDELMPGWADAAKAGAAGVARQRLSAARVIGQTLQNLHGESLLFDTVAHIDKLERSRSPHIAAVIDGVRAYGIARHHYAVQENERASRWFQVSHSVLTMSGSPLARAAMVYVISCHYYRNEYRTVELLLRPLFVDGEYRRRYPAALSKLYWLRARTHVYAGRGQAAIDDYSQALLIFDRLGERESSMDMYDLLADAYAQVGHHTESVKYRYRALQGLTSNGTTWRELAILIGAARTALLTGSPNVALCYLNRQIEKAKKPPVFTLRVNALLWRARIEESLGRAERASADVHEAMVTATLIPDQHVRMQATTTVEFVQNRLVECETDDERLEMLRDAIEYAEVSGNHFRLSALYVAQGEMYARRGFIDDAEKSFELAIGEIETQRGFLADDELRSAYFGDNTGAYERLIQLHADRDDDVAAFYAAERSRARTLLDRVNGEAVHRMRASSTSELRRLVPSDLAVVEYALLDDQLLTWVLTSRSFDMYRNRVTRSEAEVIIAGYLDAVSISEHEKVVAGSRRLFDLLVQPWLSATREMQIAFVPHGRLTSLPFAALMDANGKYLIEDRSLFIVPSVEILLRSVTRRRLRTSHQARSVLIVAAYAGEEEERPMLSDARREGLSLARTYPGAVLQVGREATKSSFRRAVGRSQIVHFAGHSESANDGLDSRISFYDGELYAGDIGKLVLSDTDLVYLGACGSGREVSPGQQGIASLAKAFVAAGASTVVATLGVVDDDLAAAFAIAFHQQIVAGVGVADALRATQIEAMRSPDIRVSDVRNWSSFVIIGLPNGREVKHA